MKTIILGITGSIAAYKAADIANTLTKNNHDVHAVLTQSGAAFITPLTLQSLTKNRVFTHILQEDDPAQIVHVMLPQRAHALVIAPATANVIAKIACGIADDMLTAMALAAYNIPLLVAPAMNTRMYENPVTQLNLRTLAERGWIIIPPRSSRLACGHVGPGALASVDTIVKAVEDAL
jgi:phosphopantothenoylcysteine decarboxylase